MADENEHYIKIFKKALVAKGYDPAHSEKVAKVFYDILNGGNGEWNPAQEKELRVRGAAVSLNNLGLDSLDAADMSMDIEDALEIGDLESALERGNSDAKLGTVPLIDLMVIAYQKSF